jgi:hypothetical protein
MHAHNGMVNPKIRSIGILIRKHGATRACVVNAMPQNLPSERCPSTHRRGHGVRSRGAADVYGEEKMSCPQGLRTPGLHSIASQYG